MDKYLRDLDKTIKKQNKQMDTFRKAEILLEDGKIDEAIVLLEKIMYEEGLVVRGARWPFVLSDIYLKHNMNDKCWKYLNHIDMQFPDIHGKVREIQAKILKKEKRYLDALLMKMVALLTKHAGVEFKPTEEKIEKELSPYIKNAQLIVKQNELMGLFNKHLKTKPFNEELFREEFKNIISK